MTEQRQPKTYNQISQLPATMEQRTCTDLFCLILGVSFTVIMLIVASVCFSHGTMLYKIENYLKSNFPADSDGSLCGYDTPQFQYLYFANLPQIVILTLYKNQRVCVQQCPKQGDVKLKCTPTNDIGCRIGNGQKFTVKYYENEPLQNRDGFFCWPTSTELQNEINSRSNLEQRNAFYNSIDTIKYGIIIAFGVSILFFVLVQFLASKISYVVVGLGMVVLLTTIICIFTYSTALIAQKVAAGVILTLILIFFAVTVFKHFDSMKLYSIYLKWSTKMFIDRKLSVVYILIFFVFLIGFLGIMVWEFTGFWSAGNINFDPNNQIYHQLSGTFPTVMTFFMFVQLIWGLSFIKQAFNFCISGISTHWFLEENKGDDHPNVKKSVWYPGIVMVRKHLGTVIASAFMTGFFSVFDAIFDTLRPKQFGTNEIYQKCFSKVCFLCTEVFDFVRSDSLAFVNLAGNPYCNSSRYCEMLCRKSVTTQYSQSTGRVYRLSAHILLMGIVGVITLYMNGNISIYAELFILIETIFISTLFISYHSDSAEAIQIILLTMEELYYMKNRDKNQYVHKDDLLLLKNERIRVDLIEQIALERKRQIDKDQA